MPAVYGCRGCWSIAPPMSTSVHSPRYPRDLLRIDDFPPFCILLSVPGHATGSVLQQNPRQFVRQPHHAMRPVAYQYIAALGGEKESGNI